METDIAMWDTHIHCLDPARHPLKATRKYTPAPAPLDALAKSTVANRVVLVQATIENGPFGLMDHLARIRTEHPRLLARGIVCMDESWDSLSEDDIDEFHRLGVRFVRFHRFSQGRILAASDMMDQFRLFASSHASQKQGWGISATLPLEIWASLKDFILHDPDVAHVQFIADHVGCASPADLTTPGFYTFAELLQDKKMHVKISALYRRTPDDISKMKPIIQKLADDAPNALLWGSDWPHVDTQQQSLHPPTKPQDMDIRKELLAIRSWMTDEQLEKMFWHNPERVFGK